MSDMTASRQFVLVTGLLLHFLVQLWNDYNSASQTCGQKVIGKL